MADDSEALTRDFIRDTVLRALVPHDETRRRFLTAVGSSTAYAAAASLEEAVLILRTVRTRARCRPRCRRPAHLPLVRDRQRLRHDDQS
jgi:hypothetical protein